jgi:hypothetical protein
LVSDPASAPDVTPLAEPGSFVVSPKLFYCHILVMKEIELTQGFVTIVDDDDYENLIQYKWGIVNGYAVHGKRLSNPRRMVSIMMHRLITGAADDMVVDHIDRNKLNNVKSNLRVVTQSKNLHNSGPSKNNTTGFKGVHFHKKAKKFMASICINRKVTYLGLFKTAEEAHDAYVSAAKENGLIT